MATRHSRLVRIALILALVTLCGASAEAEPFLEGRVSRVFDGDTLEVLLAGDEVRRVRLAGIDTPEHGQPWAKRAKQALTERVVGKQVRINEVDVDRYGRTVGEVYADNVCVGCELVREGHAWVYRHFSDDPVLLELEAEARAAKRGLWGLSEAERTPPWEWRRKRRRADQPSPGKPTPRPPELFSCGEDLFCSQMTSCAEARFHLEVCKSTHIDGDGDGVPCEKLCNGR